MPHGFPLSKRDKLNLRVILTNFTRGLQDLAGQPSEEIPDTWQMPNYWYGGVWRGSSNDFDGIQDWNA